MECINCNITFDLAEEKTGAADTHMSRRCTRGCGIRQEEGVATDRGRQRRANCIIVKREGGDG